MKRGLLLGLVLCIAGASAARAQSGPDNDPDAAPGFVNSVFHHGQVDSINLYNGQLTIPVALGPSYPVGPNLKFQAVLTFNSRSTEFGQPTAQVDRYVYQPLAGNSALGQGWEFTLGAIKFCKHGKAGGVCYFGPDGGQHMFNQGSRTGDGSQLALSGAGPYDMWDGDGNHYVFGWQVSGLDDRITVSPGYIHDFGMGRDGWYLTSVTDPFGNSYSVSYYTAVPPCWSYGSPSGGTCILGPAMTCPATPVQTWIPRVVSLPTATVQIRLGTQGTTSNMISDFIFPVSGGAESVWSLSYEQAWDNFHTCSSYSIYLPVETQRITRIQLPPELGGAPSYRFSYACPLTMTLPTGATISYEFGPYTFYHGRAGAVIPNCQGMTPQNVPYVDVSFPSGDCPFSAPTREAPTLDSAVSPTCSLDNDARWVDTVAGVVRRTETIPGAGGSPAIVATTDYTQYSFPYGEQGSTASKLDSQTLTVVLSPPDADARRRAKAVLFRSTPKPIGPAGTLSSAPGDRVGADLEERVFENDPNNTAIAIATSAPACGGGSDQPFCSSRAARVIQRTYEYDDCNADGFTGGTVCNEIGNRRLKSEATCFGGTAASGACLTGLFHAVTFSNQPGKDWDIANGRHYNIEQHSGSLGNDGRTVTTFWTPSLSPWLPNLFNRRTDALGSSTLDRYFEFTQANGFARGEFLYDASRQIVFLTCRYDDGAGNVGQDFSATYPGQTSPPPFNACSLVYPTFPTVAVGINGDAFGKIYTHRNGLLLSARWMADPVTPAGWFVKNLFRDLTTGWILASADTAGVSTSYSYDSLGRTTRISPPGEASTLVSYDSTTQTTATRDGGPGLSTVQQYLYDGLGRLGREIRRMPASSASPYALRLTRYDGAGHTSFVSEWAGCASPGGCASSSPGAGTATSDFDPFGRPQAIRKADGATTTISYADGSSLFSDTRKSVTENNINGTCSSGCAGGTSATTARRYDAFGRLTAVTEPGGDVTTYSYDVNGKLTQVSQGPQTRSFAYDAAGFLRFENTPEKGPVSYDSYGSLGNVLSETEPGGLVVSSAYDFAGRLTGTLSGGQRYLTNCYDGQACADGNPGYSGGGHPFGRLTRRIGFNPQVSSAPVVTDDLAYSDPTGRLSSQTTTVAGAGNLSATQQWRYNSLGLLAHHYHPRPGGAAPFAVSVDYDAGLPIAEYVNGVPIVTGVRYQPSGSLWAYATGIGIGHDVTTSILQDSTSLLPRPSRILATAQGAPSPAFDTLGYSYDGAGNIAFIGSDSFSYDARSRLMSASLAGIGSQAYAYDRYGNLLSKAGNTFCSGACPNNQVTGASYLRGNLTSFAGQSFAYDGLDRMTSSQSSGLLWSYAYDGGDERVAKVPPAGNWIFTLRDEGKRVVSEYAGTTPSRDNAFLGNQLVLSYSNAAVGGGGPVWTFYASDHLGTPRLVTDLAGSTVESRRYWPYGDAVPPQGTFESLRFATMEFDAEGGTGPGLASDRYYDHARSLVGGLGRFLSPDRTSGSPENPQTWNRYLYTIDNPVKYVDADGHATSLPPAITDQTKRNAAIRDRVASFLERSGNGLLRAPVDAVLSIVLPQDASEVTANSLPLVGELAVSASGSRVLSEGTTVLGHFPEYLQKADELGARRFSIPTQIWASMGEGQRWAANEKFLERVAARRDKIVLSNHITKVRPGSSLEREVKYMLSQKKYTVSPDGLALLPPAE